MSKKVTIHVNEVYKAKYGKQLNELKELLEHTLYYVNKVLADPEAEAPYVSAGQIVAHSWQSVIQAVANKEWDLEFAMKSIQALNKVLPEDLQENAEFTAGFTTVMSASNETERNVLHDMGLVMKEIDIN